MAARKASAAIPGHVARQGVRIATTAREKKRPGSLPRNKIYGTDARIGMAGLPDHSVDCVVTSPPYWATRDYGVKPTRWPDGCISALGLEPTADLYIEHLCLVLDEVRRVLKPTGTLWINLGDKYCNAKHHRNRDRTPQAGRPDEKGGFQNGRFRHRDLPDKCLALIPYRVALAMIDRGWILRNDIVWHKPNHMPASVKDRFATSWEHMFLFVRAAKYYFDLDAVRVPHQTLDPRRMPTRKMTHARPSPHIDGARPCPNPGQPQSAHPLGKNPGDVWRVAAETRTLGAITGQAGAVKVPGGAGWVGHVPGGMARIVRESDPRWLPPKGKNPGDVWDIHTRPSSLGHFATFPEKLVERPILAGCPSHVCKRCGTPRLTRAANAESPESKAIGNKDHINKVVLGCACKRGFEPGIVLDPFMGTGTTAVVAKRFGRRFIGFELNPNYVQTARLRLAQIANEK